MLIAVIKMAMPKKCVWDCPFCNGEGAWCQLSDTKVSREERPKNCPLHEIDENRIVFGKEISTPWDSAKESLKQLERHLNNKGGGIND